MKYLVATDGSENANACVQDLRSSNLSADDLIKVIAVWDVKKFAIIPARLDKATAERLVVDTVGTLTLSFPGQVTGECVRGDVVSNILRVAKIWSADKTLIGAHAYTELPEALIGNIAKEVLCKSTNTVVVYKHVLKGHPGENPKKVLWCIDTAPLAERVFAVLPNQIDLPTAAHLRLLHILQPDGTVKAKGLSHQAEPGLHGKAALHASMQKLMDEQVEKVSRIRPDIVTTTAIVEGTNPVAGIIHHASEWHTDLIVTGAHTYTLGERILLGSVSEEIAHRAKCSVEVIR